MNKVLYATVAVLLMRVGWVTRTSVSAATNSVTLSASYDETTGEHTEKHRTTGPAKITCLTATGTPMIGVMPGCKIQAPGVGAAGAGGISLGLIPKPQEDVESSGAGYVILSCTGRPPLKCSAKVTW